MDPSNLEDFLAPAANVRIPLAARTVVVAVVVFLAECPTVPAVFDVAKQLNAKLVWVELCRRASKRTAMMIAIVDHVGRREPLPGHDGRVPIAGPTLVHNLRLPLRSKVISLVSNDRQHV